MTKIQQSMILTKHFLVSCFMLTFLPTTGLGQNVMNLPKYMISSSQLDSIINMVLDDVEDGDIVSVSAQKMGENHYMLFFSAYPIGDLQYSSDVLGCIQIQNVTILFRPSLNEFITKDSISHSLQVKCIPTQAKGKFLTIPMKDGVKKWIFSLIDGCITLERKILKW